MNSVYLNNSIYEKLLEIIETNEPCILSTVCETQGSTPQKQGSSALITKKGLIAGTVGGGVVESEIIKKAAGVFLSKQSCYCRFNLANDIQDEEASICGGGMSIILDANPQKHIHVFAGIKASLAKRIPGVLITKWISGPESNTEVERSWVTRESLQNLISELKGDTLKSLTKMLGNPVQGEFREIVNHTSPGYEDNYVFLESIVPVPRLIIAGAGHVGKALSHYGKLLDFEVTVWDDRKDFASKANLPEAGIILNGKPEKGLGSIKVDSETYIVIVTHGHKNDADVLKLFVNSNAAYIGMIGSKRKIAQVREKFLQNGWTTAEKWERIHSPVGLDIHSKSVQEIALSIAAQMVKVKNEKNTANG